MMDWETVIGLEVHVQLKTKSKIFSGSSTLYGAEPNTQACIVDLAIPGTLPVLNIETVHMAIKFGLATHAEIAKYSVFARKNYFYPDLPKGYQISQFDLPIVKNGHLDITINDQIKRIGITRAHLEEDAGKSLHEISDKYTAIDYNRSGIPLLEIVSQPDMNSAKEAIAYLKSLYDIVKYIDICDGNMQEGSFRIDVNISIKPKNSSILGTRTEIKNINSFKFVEQAINHEVNRQTSILEDGGKIIQETLLYDPQLNKTKSMRSKEEANDYRYFPDPDLPPIIIGDALIAKIQAELPELPHQKLERFKSEYNLSEYDARFLVSDKQFANYFEKTTASLPNASKTIVNWIMGDLSAYINKFNLPIENCPITPEMLANLIQNIEKQIISTKTAKIVFDKMWLTRNSADYIIKVENLAQSFDLSELNQLIDQVLQDNHKQVLAYQAGKDKLLGFFVGHIMKITHGKTNPEKLEELLKNKLKSNTPINL